MTQRNQIENLIQLHLLDSRMQEIFTLLVDWIDSIENKQEQQFNLLSSQIETLSQQKQQQEKEINQEHIEIQNQINEIIQSDEPMKIQYDFSIQNNNYQSMKQTFNSFLQNNQEKKYCFICFSDEYEEFGIIKNEKYSFFFKNNNKYHHFNLKTSTNDSDKSLKEKKDIYRRDSDDESEDNENSNQNEIQLISNENQNDILFHFGTGSQRLIISQIGSHQSYSYFFDQLIDFNSEDKKHSTYFNPLQRFSIKRFMILSN